MQVFRQFTFDSAHFLPNVPQGHRCREIHGHTYRMVIYLEGDLQPHLEWIIDFAEVKKIVAPVVDSIDHKLLNNIEGLENPTCERIAIWLWNKIKPQLPMLKKIELFETPNSGVVYRGE